MSLLLQADQKQHLEYVVHQPSKGKAKLQSTQLYLG